MRLHFLGTGGWYDTPLGNTPSVLVETAEAYLVLDAGNGIHKLTRYVADDRPVHLFLSHYHLDHIAGLHILSLFDFRGGLHIYGPPGLKKHLGTLVRRPFTAPVSRLRYPVRLHELKEGKRRAPVPFEAARLQHSSLCYGYRFRIEGKTVAYCTDTGMCDTLVRLAEEADLLITESSLPPGDEVLMPGHLTPGQAAEAAAEAEVRSLVLTHFQPTYYHGRADRKAAEAAARKLFARTRAAFDGMSLSL